MDETIISTLVNIPMAIVLIYWVKLDFQQRGKNMDSMARMVELFTSAMKECCKGDELTEVKEKVNHS